MKRSDEEIKASTTEHGHIGCNLSQSPDHQSAEKKCSWCGKSVEICKGGCERNFPTPRSSETITIVPSPRIDWCGDCKMEHGFECPTTDTSDWRERFDELGITLHLNMQGLEELDGAYTTQTDAIKAFIANELAIQSRRQGGAITVLMESAKLAGQASERARLREKIEGMKMKQRHVECENGKAETCDICFFTMSRNQVLSDLLDILKD